MDLTVVEGIRQKILKVGDLNTNCYILSNRNGETAIIDPGDEAARIIEEIERTKNLTLKYVLLTHGHFDHVLAVDDLYIKYPYTSIIIANEDIDLFRNLSLQGAYVGKTLHNPKAEVVAVSEGSTLRFGDETISVIYTPGHTKGSVCFKIADSLYSGDTIFYHTRGRIDLPTSQPSSMKESIDKILRLPDKTSIYPGHGRDTTIKEEKQFVSQSSDYF